jgi:hypothetical protein
MITVLVCSRPQAIMDGPSRPTAALGPKTPDMIEQATYIYQKGWGLTRRRKTIPETCEGTEIPPNVSGNRLHLLIAGCSPR